MQNNTSEHKGTLLWLFFSQWWELNWGYTMVDKRSTSEIHSQPLQLSFTLISVMVCLNQCELSPIEICFGHLVGCSVVGAYRSFGTRCLDGTAGGYRYLGRVLKLVLPLCFLTYQDWERSPPQTPVTASCHAFCTQWTETIDKINIFADASVRYFVMREVTNLSS